MTEFPKDNNPASEKSGPAQQIDVKYNHNDDARENQSFQAPADANKAYYSADSDEGRALISEVEKRGDKISDARIIGIGRDAANDIVWLEQGHLDGKPSGLAHIIEEHEANFNAIGIATADIPDFILTAAMQGKIVGYQCGERGRPIYQVTYHGKQHEVAITIGSNGYIVGANPNRRR